MCNMSPGDVYDFLGEPRQIIYDSVEFILKHSFQIEIDLKAAM